MEPISRGVGAGQRTWGHPATRSARTGWAQARAGAGRACGRKATARANKDSASRGKPVRTQGDPPVQPGDASGLSRKQHVRSRGGLRGA